MYSHAVISCASVRTRFLDQRVIDSGVLIIFSARVYYCKVGRVAACTPEVTMRIAKLIRHFCIVTQIYIVNVYINYMFIIFEI